MHTLTTSVIWVIVAIVAISMGLPFFWMVTTALKDWNEVLIFPPVWFPAKPMWDNFVVAWQQEPFGRYYINSTITMVSGTVAEVLIAAFSAYALARIQFRFREIVFMVILAAMMIPSQMSLIPNYVTVYRLGWIDTYQGMVVPSISSVFGTFLLRQAFLSMSPELFDAAKIDGAGHLYSMFGIALPLARPVVATLTLYLATAKWNHYLWPLIVTNTRNMRTLPVGLAWLAREGEFGDVGEQHKMAAVLIVLIPMFLIYALAQKQLIEGISAGALKG
jgi:ABC-type glycerol-3-phosphate transport system permease component